MRPKLLSVLTLFTSSGTLICCVLPMVIATIAGGASVGTLLTLFPWLIPLSMHKGWIFMFSGTLIAISGYLTFRKSREVACDTNSGEEACDITGRFNKRMFYLSSFIFLIGGFVSYLLAPLMNLFN